MTFFSKFSNIESYFSFKKTEAQKVAAMIFDYRIKKAFSKYDRNALKQFIHKGFLVIE